MQSCRGPWALLRFNVESQRFNHRVTNPSVEEYAETAGLLFLNDRGPPNVST